MENDWQFNLQTIKDRGRYLLKTQKFPDCRFLVGTSPNQRIMSGHRLLLAMASPVFEAMFYGSLPVENDPIALPDIMPHAFKAILDYIYTEEISIISYGDAWDLYYVAKKYMISYVVEYCRNFLLAYLTPQFACRLYEFAKFFEESSLMQMSMELIVATTTEVIAQPSFMDIEISTLMDILDENSLNVDSELDLFNCLLKFAKKNGLLNDGDEDKTDAGSEDTRDVVVERIKMEPEDSNSGAAASTSAGTCDNVPITAGEVVEVDSDASASRNAGASGANVINITNAQRIKMDLSMLRQAVKKIRFLTMTPEEFSEGPARSKLLQQFEVSAILRNISNQTNNDCPMPEGFCQLSKRETVRNQYKIGFSINEHSISEIENNTLILTYSRLTFKLATNMYSMDIFLKYDHCGNSLQCFSVSLQNIQGTEIACVKSTDYLDCFTFKLTFLRRIFIHRSQQYNIKIKRHFLDSSSAKFRLDKIVFTT